MVPCTNCGRSHVYSFCPECGQKRVEAGIRLREVIDDAIQSVLNFDGPFFRTFQTFFRGPARLSREFLAGRRRFYSSPVRFFLFGVAYYYLVRWVLQWDPVDAAVMDATGGELPDTPAMEVNHWISRNVNLLLPILLLLLTSFDRLLFPRTSLRWVERLVHYLFAVGAYLFITSTLLLLFVKFWPQVQYTTFLVIFSILIWACINLHRRSIWNVVKAVVMVPFTFVIYILVSMLIVAVGLGYSPGEIFVPSGRSAPAIQAPNVVQ